ncbi:hypothetical protein LCGC14_0406870 [marine sediment metagenome]|uniref:Uncharacterized protein n=1 Tax=marine sediment metagenome TaxID=412755 RepID=A0A0F9TD93_9ZZZZ
MRSEKEIKEAIELYKGYLKNAIECDVRMDKILYYRLIELLTWILKKSKVLPI